jgi:hypothetical protein
LNGSESLFADHVGKQAPEITRGLYVNTYIEEKEEGFAYFCLSLIFFREFIIETG